MHAQSLLDLLLLPSNLTPAPSVQARRHTQQTVADLHSEIHAFCSDAKRQAAGLDFTPRSLASDILSVFAAGALIGSMREGDLDYSACGKALRSMLRSVFGWEDCDAAIRAGALLEAARQRGSRFAYAVESGGAAFCAWRDAADRLELEDFREVYIFLSTATPHSARM